MRLLLRSLPQHILSFSRRMSTQTIAVLAESELKNGQMKQVPFANGQVLLSRIDNQIHATSAYCTHYGAPLAKGVLSSGGRIVCPWHGACFSVWSGDIEDAPAPNAIHRFQAHVADGQIYVTADPSATEKDNMARRPAYLASYPEGSEKGVLIIGGGSGAFHTVNSLRSFGYSGAITIITREPHGPIDRTKLSKQLLTDVNKLEWRNPADLKIKFGVTLRTGVEVTSVDLKSKTVYLNGTDESLSYQKLVIATGGTPRRLPIEGADLGGVTTFRGVQDATVVDAALKEGTRLVIIGSSFIGLEIAGAISKRKLASIDIVGMDEVPFQSILGKEVGSALKKYYEAQGVKFHMSTQVQKIVPKEEDSSIVGGVVIGGETLPADFVVMAVGVTPATQFLEGSGIPLEKDGAIKVDQFLNVQGISTGDKDVYAIGDVALYPQVTGEYTRIEHWNVAGNHGRALGATLSGSPRPFHKVPVFWSGQGLRYCGVGSGFDDTIIVGDVDSLKFVAYYAKDGKIVAVASMQNDPVVSKASELLRLGLMPTPEEIRNGADILSADITVPGLSSISWA
jgi:NADPH-dependent 2,4-dienoyl-CoA reductase/sulfur reductase-like enzyme/nitrite reductase/ring-hydroxylating ferredoxin subunit